MAQGPIRLDDLLLREVSVQWFEGVALVQELCRQLSTRSGTDEVFPGAAQISLSSDGTVTMGGAAETKAVPAARHILARMLGADVPVRLRLLVTQATPEDASSGSLLEFSESLAYFQRPDPERILSALYARAAVAPQARRQDQQIADPMSEPTPQASSPEPRERKRRHLVVVAAGALVLSLVTALFVRVGLRDGRLVAVVQRLESAIAIPAEATIDTRGDDTKGPGAAEITATGVATAKSRSAVPAVPNRTSVAPVLESEQSIVLEPALDDVLPEGAGDMIEATSGSNKVYSRSDASVTPPRQVYSAMPARPSSGKRQEDLTVLDLVIGANGQVEHVRLRTPPRDVHEFMLVSAAKAWWFDPATVDGRPVRFQLSVAITSHD